MLPFLISILENNRSFRNDSLKLRKCSDLLQFLQLLLWSHLNFLLKLKSLTKNSSYVHSSDVFVYKLIEDLPILCAHSSHVPFFSAEIRVELVRNDQHNHNEENYQNSQLVLFFLDNAWKSHWNLEIAWTFWISILLKVRLGHWIGHDLKGSLERMLLTAYALVIWMNSFTAWGFEGFLSGCFSRERRRYAFFICRGVECWSTPRISCGMNPFRGSRSLTFK